MTRPSRLPARLVLALGLGAAAALIAVALLDLGDPGAAALERQEAEAQSLASLTHARWRERLQAAPLLAEALSDVRVEAATASGPADRAAMTDASEEGEEDRLRVRAARASALGGDALEASRQLAAVIARGAAASGGGLLLLCRIERGRVERGRVENASDGASAAAAAYLEHADSVPWNAGSDGTSGRLLALMSVGADLAEDRRATEAKALRAALGEGAVALPEPVDRVHVDPAGFRFEADPWWSALAIRASERLGGDRAAWAEAFDEPARRARAFEALAGEVTDTWTLRPTDAGPWLAARRGGSAIHLAAHAPDQLTRALQGHAAENALAPSAFADAGAAANTTVLLTGPLAGTDAPLAVVHPDPEAVARVERRRIRFLRAGLIALAALVGLATAAAARMMAKARELHSLRATFVASVSHDLRTPLASIGLMAENLGSGYAKGREEVYVGSIQRETARLRRLVDDLLDFGRLERGLLPSLTRASVDAAEWLDEVAARERARCAAAGAALSLEIEGSLGRASIDPGALERAIANLVDNALKHGEAKSIRLRARQESSAVLAIEVEDGGRGLGGGSVHEHLFEPFERRSENDGTGLGLTIVRAIAEAHGGTATLRAGAAGRGTVARIEVRGCDDDSAEPAA